MIDIIIPTKNSDLLLDECLTCLSQQSVSVNVYVVDGGSTDNTLEIAQKHQVNVLKEPEHKVNGSHRAVACNEGLRHCTSEYIGFIDDDTRVPPTWAENLLTYLKNDYIAGVTSGCIDSSTTKTEKAISKLIKLGSTHAHSFKHMVPLTSIPGYNSIYRRNCLLEVDGFNEDIGGCEDWELNKRLRDRGYILCGVPDDPVRHIERHNVKAFSHQMNGYAYSRGRLLKVAHIFTYLHVLPLLSWLILLAWYPYGSILILSGLLAYMFLVNTLDQICEKTPQILLNLLLGGVMYVDWVLGYLRGLLF